MMAEKKDRVPPAAVAEAAKKGLELRETFGRGGTMIGVARARDLQNRRAVSDDVVRRMASFFARHAVDKRGKNFGEDDNPSAGYVAWLLWGGDAGRDWAAKEQAKLDEDKEK